MNSFTVKTPLYVNQLSGVWDKIPTHLLEVLNINLKGVDVKISAQKQFEIYYRGRSLIYSEIEEANDAFLMVFFGNKAQFILKQIELTEGELINKLIDFDIWADVTKSSVNNIGDRTNLTKTDNKNTNRGGSTDSNSLMEANLITEHFTPEKASPIGPNVLTQNIIVDDGLIKTTDNNTNKTESTTSFSNFSLDIIKFIELDLPDLRQKFWSLFHCLFSY